jgi:hypothetical protein
MMEVYVRIVIEDHSLSALTEDLDNSPSVILYDLERIKKGY